MLAETTHSTTIENSQGHAPVLEFRSEIDDLSHLVRAEIARLKKTKRDKPDESQVKDLVTLTKLMQTLCDFACDARRAEQESNDSGHDILELRKKIERKIEALDSVGSGGGTA